MQNTIFLATGAEAFEIVTAVVIIIVTGVALYFLYRNVAYEIAEARKQRLAMKEREEMRNAGELDSDKEFELDSKDLKDLGLFALINHYIAKAKEGDLSALYTINLDDFGRIVENEEEKNVQKVIAEVSKRLKKYGGKMRSRDI